MGLIKFSIRHEPEHPKIEHWTKELLRTTRLKALPEIQTHLVAFEAEMPRGIGLLSRRTTVKYSGQAYGRKAKTEGPVAYIYVPPAHQHWGIAKNLLKALEGSALNAGHKRLLPIAPMSQRSSSTLRDSGYEPLGLMRDVSRNLMVMEKRLIEVPARDPVKAWLGGQKARGERP